MSGSDPSDLGAGETISFHRFAELPGVEVLRGHNCSRLWRVHHEQFAFSTGPRNSAKVEWFYRGRLHETRVWRTVTHYEPGELHYNTQIDGPIDFKVLFLRPEFVERAAGELGVHSRDVHFKYAHVERDALFRSYWNFHASLEGEATPLERQSRLAGFVRVLLETSGQSAPGGDAGGPARAGLRRAKDLIRERYAEPLSLAEVAAVAGISPFRFARAFRLAFGLPPHAYQVALRVERARQLVAKRVPPAAAAAEAGFSDQSHFIRRFRQSWGITPGQYARMVGRPPRVIGRG